MNRLEEHDALAHCCLDLDIPFRLLNPITTKQFVKATVRKKKTDPSDAWVIAKLAAQGEGVLVTAGLFNDTKPILRTSTKLAQLNDIVNRIDRRISELLPTERKLHEQLVTCAYQLGIAVTVFRQRAIEISPKDLTKLLTSIPGIGVTIAPTLIAEIGDITRFKNPKSLVAYAGLDPRVRQSGYSLQRNTRLPNAVHHIYEEAYTLRPALLKDASHSTKQPLTRNELKANATKKQPL